MLFCAAVPGALGGPAALADIVKEDAFIAGSDAGVRLFVRTKRDESTVATDRNTIVFVHGHTLPALPSFDLNYLDFSWAEWLAARGYVAVVFDVRNFGLSSREPAMSEPADYSEPLTRAYLAVRDVRAVVEHVTEAHNVDRVVLLGWGWGATAAGFYASLYSDSVSKLALVAPMYAFALHPREGTGSEHQDDRHPYKFRGNAGGYRIVTKSALRQEWEGHVPLEVASDDGDGAVFDALFEAALATDPTGETRTPRGFRVPNGPMEDIFYQATGRRLWNASSIYAPTLVIAGEYDTWSLPDDHEGLLRDLAHAPTARYMLIPEASHYLPLEKARFKLYEEVLRFLTED